MQNGMIDYFKKRRCAHPGQFVVRRLEWVLSKRETSGYSVPVKHADSIKREFVEVFAGKFY
jgi:hypothetical protein